MKIGEYQLVPEPSIPRTTAWTVIFAFDKNVKKYDRYSYSPELTDGRATTQEVDQVLSQIEAIRNPIDFKLKITTIIWFGMFVLMILAFAFLLLYDTESNSKVPVIPAIGSMIVFIVGLLRTIILQNKFEDECETILKYEINRKFASRGLRWNVVKDWPFWIELHNEFKKSSCSTRQQTVPEQPKTSNQNTGGQLHLQIYQGEHQNNDNNHHHNLYVPPSQH